MERGCCSLTSYAKIDGMAALQTLERRILALEARRADVEGGSGDTLNKLHRGSVKAELRIGEIIEHLEIEDVSDEEIDAVLDEEERGPRRSDGLSVASWAIRSGRRETRSCPGWLNISVLWCRRRRGPGRAAPARDDRSDLAQPGHRQPVTRSPIAYDQPKHVPSPSSSTAERR